MQELLSRFDAGDPVALGKLLKEVENGTSSGKEALRCTASRQGRAHVVGITGPPGAGKSTLTAKLSKRWAEAGREVGIVCVDPTSPFSGGALLGDRIRMLELSSFPNVFIKSLATRGSLGGMAASTADIIQLMDAYGKEVVVVETVGVGQVEFDVMDLSDTVVLVNVPGLGDSIQALKAGILEIADIFVINQADRPGAEDSVRDLRQMLADRKETGWLWPVVKTVATRGEGIDRLAEAIESHRAYLKREQLWEEKRCRRNRQRLMQEMDRLFRQHVLTRIRTDPTARALFEEVEKGTQDPYSAARHLFQEIVN
ncbi:methylmalonyl Co-A mutase-associated GTPase MeaB [Kyrpidia tusciae]|uniref:LAO/AO transport system ATPase n=1 Tax=Kyrpidia tusciae (strain DSM 2912 / NBRC 15312 / T2) TaxID=562970 RepID=D5WTR6_KYRT2|nr:methylmalonyl Co-A mutase-associated GTPase MeaB [Kyrpidia tusciae]ADG05236.1 LAO/AO transport system ATPase [Kyrpidia tusciae DSM 2912]